MRPVVAILTGAFERQPKRAAKKIRLLVAAPRDRQAPTLDARAVGFRTINGVDKDAAGMAEQLRREIEIERVRIGAKSSGESRA